MNILRLTLTLFVLTSTLVQTSCSKKEDPYPDDRELSNLHNLVAGSQLVVYTRTSYVNSNVASSLTYYNFCESGSFNISNDASYSAGGAHGGGQSNMYGNWELEKYQGMNTVKITYADGDVVYNPVDESRLKSGSWRIGNTEYAFQQNKAVCR